MTPSSGKPPLTQPDTAEPTFGLESRIANRNAGLGSVNEHESWSALHREAYVVLGGLSDGVQHSTADACKDWKGTGLKVGSAALLGGGLAYLQESSSMGKIGAMVIGAGFTYALVKDVLTQAVPTYDAIKDAAKSGRNLDRDRAVVAGTAGPFVVDFALSSAGGLIGAGGMRMFRGKPEMSPSAAVATSAEPTRAAAPAPAELLDSATLAKAPGAQSVYWKTLPSMLKIESARPNGLHTGSAVVVDAEGRALTNFHVVAHSEQLYAVTSDGARFRAVVEKADPGLDLALIKLTGRRQINSGRVEYIDDKFTPAALADSSQLQPGQKLFALGYSDNAVADNPRLSHGTFLVKEAPPKSIEELPSTMRSTEQIARSDVQLNPGFSGGPLLTEKGEVVALNFARNQTDGQSYAVPSDALRSFIQRRETTPDYSKFVPLLESAQRSLSNTSWNGNAEQLGRLFDTASKGVVQIMSKGTAADATPTYATAFAVDQFHLVTAAKAVGELGSAVKVTHNGVLHDNLLYVDKKFPDLGVAVLRTDRIAPLALEPLKLAPNNSLFAGGQRVVTFGFKSNMAEMTASPGQFGAYVPGIRQPMIKTFVPVAEGYGGAPIMNRLGQVIGMTPFVTEAAAETNNIHSRTLSQILRQAGIL